ncbi:MAG: gliding motility protein GldM [Paludibacteraceae bacterium]|nr:gliding motility protein GldM [Paludibacteraceae bacterium]
MGGAKNCPETPRQKMIGMMYLVLTAMLALNVSTDILNGFRLVDDSLHFTLDATELQIKSMMNDFKAAAEDNEQKNGEWYRKALELNRRADSLYNFIEDFKFNVASLANKDMQQVLDKNPGQGTRVSNMKVKDNLDVTAQYALNEHHGDTLKMMFEDYRDYLINLTDGRKRNEFEQMFSTKGGTTNDGDSITWEQVIFEGMPLGASVAILTKMQLDVRSAQNEMVIYLRDQTDAGDIRANKLEAFVIPNSQYVMRGGKYTAKIVLAAVDSTATPEYYIDGQKIGSDGIYEVVASGTGLKKYSGELVIPATMPGEEPRHIRFSSEYTVGEPSVTIANKEMDVIYSDYNNKYSISVPGVSADKVNLQVTGATAKLTNGEWIIRTTEKAKEVTMEVFAELDGKRQSMGKQKFRVKPLPEPSIFLVSNGKPISGGKIAKKELTDPDTYFEASYGEDGVLKCPYKVKSFETRINGRWQNPTTNPKFSGEMVSAIKGLQSNQDVIVQTFKVVDDQGKERTLSGKTLVFYIK